MWTTAHEPNFDKYQSGVVEGLQAGALPGTLVQLPAVIQSLLRKPQKIMVQGHPENASPVLIGKTSPLADDGSNGGFWLSAGEMFVLPDNDIFSWYIRGTGAGGQKLMYTYLAGAN